MFPLASLACFHEDEIESILCGASEPWSVDTLAEIIKFDHGCALMQHSLAHLAPSQLLVHWSAWRCFADLQALQAVTGQGVHLSSAGLTCSCQIEARCQFHKTNLYQCASSCLHCSAG